MSDADDQMGGTGGETGPPPGAGSSPGAPSPAGSDPGDGGEPDEGRGPDEGGGPDEVTERSKESFPASDPPASY